MPASLGKQYNSLITEIAEIYESALNEGNANWNTAVLVSNWKIGEKIVKVEQGNKDRAAYGEQIIKQLSKDLNQKYGKGFSARNLAYMRSFYQVYKLKALKPAISWTNYRQLLGIEDKKIRDNLETRIIKENLNSIEVQKLVKDLNKPRENENTSNLEQNTAKNLLKRPTLELFRYRVSGNFSLNFARAVQNVDLGFRVKYVLDDKLKLDKFKPGSIVTVEKSMRGFELKKSTSVRELFTYKAYLNRIIDGDTMIVHIDLGFSVFIEQRLRLRGLDAPELSEKGGQASKRLIESSLKDSPFLIIKTHGTDLYDRYLVDVFFLPNEWSEEKIINEGNHLNNRLLEEGLAERI
jgi:endonuclease YncB( thermonuclease family)